MVSLSGESQSRAHSAGAQMESSLRQVSTPGFRAATEQLRRPVWRPRFASFWTAYLVFVVLYWAVGREPRPGLIGWYITIVWTLPILASIRGVLGGILVSRRMLREQEMDRPVGVSTATLIVVVPTIGRHDTQPALRRVLHSFCNFLPAYFPRMRVDVVIEETCEASGSIAALAAESTHVRVLTIPSEYRTPKGSRFKARANEYANELRIAEGEATDDVWVLHMDDDTAVGQDTAEYLVRFIGEQQSIGEQRLHLTQGVLTYPRELAANRLTWLADAIRPGCDISLFAVATGRGSPIAGLHGELLLVRASVEATIGWDFGPRTTVEDAEFALWFSDKYNKRCDWFPGRSYGASPATVSDFIKQRERWFSGLLELAFRGTMPFLRRLLLLHNVMLWALTPFAYPGIILLVGALLSFDTGPTSAALLPLWALNVAFSIWLYWEGLKINVLSSAVPRRFWWEALSVVALLPVFLLWEVAGITRAIFHFARNRESCFAVIAKPH